MRPPDPYTGLCQYASVRRIMDKENERIGLQEIIDKAIEELAREAGDSFKLDQLNLAEFSRRTGLSRSKARSLKAKGFVVTPHGRCGIRAKSTVISGFEGDGGRPADGGRNELRGRLRAHREPGLQGRKDYCQELHLRARGPWFPQSASSPRPIRGAAAEGGSRRSPARATRWTGAS